MKKHIFRSGCMIAIALTSMGAFAEDGNVFVNASIGKSTWHDSYFHDNTDTSAALRLGYQWQVDNLAYGLEGGYVDLGKVTEGHPMSFSSDSIDGKGPLLGGNFRYDFSNGLYLSARAGWFHSQVKLEHTSEFRPSFDTSVSGNGAYLGVGVGYEINPQFGVGLNYDDYHARVSYQGGHYGGSVGVVAVSAEYRF